MTVFLPSRTTGKGYYYTVDIIQSSRENITISAGPIMFSASISEYFLPFTEDLDGS